MKDLIIKIIMQKSPYPITSTEIIEEIFKYKHQRISDIEFRKIINEIRKNGEYPIIANCKGYYISSDKEEVISQIERLQKRAKKILKAAQGLKTFLKEHSQLNLWEVKCSE